MVLIPVVCRLPHALVSFKLIIGRGGGGGGGTPSELPIPPAGSDILVEVWLLQKRWIGETGNHGGHRNVPSRPFSFGIRRKSKINMCTGHG